MVTYYYNNNGYPAYYPDEFTEHENRGNEWDRSTVLDPLWEYQQKKTFTAWCNSHLRKAGTRIENLEEDFQNGLKLMLLLEVISGEPMQRPDRGKTRFHRIANVNKALDFIRRRGVKLVSLGAESIVDGNQKMILGLIWTLILRFAIQNINVGDLSARDGLLLWCQRKTEPYHNVDVQNFSNSWRNGLAFCALIHRHRPELLDYNSLNPNNPIENLNLAFNIADKHLDIPPMLDPNEESLDVAYPSWPDEISTMTYVSSLYHAFENPNRHAPQLNHRPNIEVNGTRSKRSLTPQRSYFSSPPLEPIIRHYTPIRQMTPVHLPSPLPPMDPIIRIACDPKDAKLVDLPVLDEKSIVTYVSSFYHKFAIKSQLERAASKIANELEADRENKKLAEDYNNLATKLLDWTNKWTPWLQNRNEDHSLNDANKKLNDFRQYRLNEKPLKLEEKSELDNLHNTLQTRLQITNRAPFHPKNGQLIEDINNAFNSLDLSEKGFEEWLLSEIAKMERLQHLAQKFHQKYKIYKEWCNGKEEQLLKEDYKLANFHDLKCLRKKHEFFEAEMDDRKERVEQLVAIAKELARLNYPNMQLINKKCTEIINNWEKLENGVEKRRGKLDEMERILEKLDDLHLKFANLANPFNNWAESTREDLVDMVILSEISEIEKLLREHGQFKETLPDADQSLKELLDLDQQIQSLVHLYNLNPNFLQNPYTDLTSSHLNSIWHKLKQLILCRDAELEQEYARQKHIEQLKKEFIEKSNEIGPWLERQLETVLSIGMNSSGEDAKKIITQLISTKLTVNDKKPQIVDLEYINKQLQDNFIYSIPNSTYTMQSLRVGVEMLLTSINKAINNFENQLLITNATNQVQDPKQLNDYQKSFQHFDKDGQGLNEEQLKSFFISIGHTNDAKDAKDEKFKELKTNGRLDFNSILGYLNLSNKDICSQMCDAFKVLAGGKSQITSEDLRRELSQQQAEQCVNAMEKFFDHSTCQYNYEAFCRSFYSS